MRINLKEDDEHSVLQELEKYPLELLLEAVLSKFNPHSSEDGELKAKLAVLNSLISLHDLIAESGLPQKTRSFSRKVTIAAVHSSLSSPDFHQIEYTDYGPPTRWTGPSPHFSFDCFVDRSINLVFSLDFESVYFSRPVEEMKCYVDGDEIELHVEKAPDGYLASGKLPLHNRQGATIITFSCPDMKSPRENNQHDDRLLGVRFRRLTVEEVAPRFVEDPPLRVVKTAEELDQGLLELESVTQFRPRIDKSRN